MRDENDISDFVNIYKSYLEKLIIIKTIKHVKHEEKN